MSDEQKRTAWILAAIGLLYFVIFIFPNNIGAKDEHMLFVLSTDEHITYPYTLQMVTPGENLAETLYGWIAYQDYHYGYPFYLSSALVILPVRIAFGDGMASHMQLSLLLLRQFINVLPMTLLIYLLVYLQTRFRSRIKSIGLFVFLLSIQGVVRSNMQWWHPDSLAILAVVLTFYFLDKDHLRFGKNFFMAAAACGLAVGVKMVGFFFFLTIGGYILAGLLQRVLPLKKSIVYSLLFILTMAGTIIITNPLLIPERSRSRIFEIQSKIRYETTHGWDDSDEYDTGLAAWHPYLKRWYGQEYYFVLAFLSLAASCFWGERKFLNRMIAGWVIPYGLYLIYFIAVKPDHYWLPIVLPWFSAIFSWIPDNLNEKGKFNIRRWNELKPSLRWTVSLAALSIILITGQFVVNLAGDVALYRSAVMQEELLRLNIHE